MKDKADREANELAEEFHTELYTCVEYIEQAVINDFLLDDSWDFEERRAMCKAFCSIIAQITSGVNMAALFRWWNNL